MATGAENVEVEVFVSCAQGIDWAVCCERPLVALKLLELATEQSPKLGEARARARPARPAQRVSVSP